MGVEKIMLRRGNGIDVPKKHDEVSMEYTGSSSNPIAQAQGSSFMQGGFTTTMLQTAKANSESDLFFGFETSLKTRLPVMNKQLTCAIPGSTLQ
jgi:hypothetical protein